jgi:catechol-2,3-dioxygenase
VGAIVGLAEIVLHVHDFDASLGFYRDLLGLEVLGTPPGKPAPVFLRAGDAQVAIPQMLVLVPLKGDQGTFAKPNPLHHIALEVPESEFDAERARLVEAGLEVRTGEHPVIRSKTLYIDDPDGNEVELISARTD